VTGFADLLGGVAVFLFFGAPTFALGWLAGRTRRSVEHVATLQPRCHTCGVPVGTIYCGHHLSSPLVIYRRPDQLSRFCAIPLDLDPVRGDVRAWFHPED
jgi:hypothetical protein